MRAVGIIAACAITCLTFLGRALADSSCRVVELRFKPGPQLQLAVWMEDAQGKHLDTIYVTRLTGLLGLGNRPGNHRFKSDFRFPYGRRDMVLPVWAHARDRHYGLVVMGGAYGNSIASCVAALAGATDCNDDSIGYHFLVSSPESFFCSPSGGVTTQVNGVDVTSCASPFYGCKGAYADPPAYSLYPPRADLSSFLDSHDGVDAKGYAALNDLAAISGATPVGMQLIDPPLRWTPPGDGAYVLKLEASLEGDFNAYHHHPQFDDASPELNGFGEDFLGQPSVVYALPFTVGPTPDEVSTSSYLGYGDWDGASGTLHPPDATITVGVPGSGADRLLDHSDGTSTWKLKLTASSDCSVVPAPPDGGAPPGDGGSSAPSCPAPAAPVALALTAHATSVDLAFESASTGVAPARFDVRYREESPITEANFVTAIPSSTPPPPPGAPGSPVTMSITGLRPEKSYHVGVRALSACGAPSPVTSTPALTGRQQFTVLHGCFLATAAYGSALAVELEALRRLRDRHLLSSPLGRLGVATYYALSPALAAAIAADERLRAAARGLIAPLVELVGALEERRAGM